MSASVAAKAIGAQKLRHSASRSRGAGVATIERLGPSLLTEHSSSLSLDAFADRAGASSPEITVSNECSCAKPHNPAVSEHRGSQTSPTLVIQQTPIYSASVNRTR